MTMKKVSNKYISTLIRKRIRMVLNNNYKDIRYKIVNIAKVCVEYDNIFGTNLVWDTTNNYWVTPNKKMDLFNTACQLAANSMNCSVEAFKELSYIIRELGMVEDGNQFYMPSTKKVIKTLFK